MKKEFGIKVISTACAVMPHTIRAWEKRYQVFTPERSEGGIDYTVKLICPKQSLLLH